MDNLNVQLIHIQKNFGALRASKMIITPPPRKMDLKRERHIQVFSSRAPPGRTPSRIPNQGRYCYFSVATSLETSN